MKETIRISLFLLNFLALYLSLYSGLTFRCISAPALQTDRLSLYFDLLFVLYQSCNLNPLRVFAAALDGLVGGRDSSAPNNPGKDLEKEYSGLLFRLAE